MFLDYVLFLKRLAIESSLKALDENQRVITPEHIEQVTKVAFTVSTVSVSTIASAYGFTFIAFMEIIS